jgi:DNA polymerase-3 subunit alpha
MAAVLENAMEDGGKTARERQAGQTSMFDMLGSREGSGPADEYPDIPEWNEGDLLAFEKETIGFYITGHPLGGSRGRHAGMPKIPPPSLPRFLTGTM